jgi:hypothetical protein
MVAVGQVCVSCGQGFEWVTPSGPPRCRSCWQAHCRGLASRGLLQAVPLPAARPTCECGAFLIPSGGCWFCFCGHSSCG